MNKFFEILAKQEIGKIIVISMMLTALYWYTMYEDGSAVEAQIVQVQQDLEKEQGKKKDTDNTLKQVKEMQEKVGLLGQKYEQISKRLPTNLFSIDINKAIDEFAKNAGVNVIMKKPGQNVVKSVTEEVPVEVSLLGTYSQLAQFTYLVSNSEKMSRVVDISISEPEPGTKKMKFDAQVVGYKIAPDEKNKTSGDGNNQNQSGESK